MKPFILVVDDEPDIRHLVKDILEDEGYEVEVAENGAVARAAFHTRIPDLTLLDIWMPDVDGITLLKEFNNEGLDAPVVMISGHGTVETAVEATRLGAMDFIEKPLSMGKLLTTVERAISESRKLRKDAPVRARSQMVEPVGRSQALRSLRELAHKVADQTSCVLMTGEPGTGKSLFARYIHLLGADPGRPFVAVNLASLDTNSAHRTLFGSAEAGAMISAGAFAEASGGTLFINNISAADLSVQSRLLDVLSRQEHYYGHSGATLSLPRIIAATSEELRELLDVGQFRADLYYKLNELPFHVPALREHREDVPELVVHFVDQAVNEDNATYRKFSFAAQNWLRNYSWPGNVLELRNAVKSLLIMGDGADVEVDEVKSILGHSAPAQDSSYAREFDQPLREARDQFEKAYLEYHLRAAEGNVGVVARKAGMERTHLYRKFRALGIDPKKA